MGKKEKPVKVAFGKFEYKGWEITQKGREENFEAHKEGVDALVNAKNLHDAVKMIDNIKL